MIQYVIDITWAKARTGGDAACGGIRRRYVRISTVVDIQQRTLCAFKHHEVAAFARLIQQIGNIDDHSGQGCQQSPSRRPALSGSQPLPLCRSSLTGSCDIPSLLSVYRRKSLYRTGRQRADRDGQLYLRMLARYHGPWCRWLSLHALFHAQRPAQRDNRIKAADVHEPGYHGLPVLSSLSSAQLETTRHRYR